MSNQFNGVGVLNQTRGRRDGARNAHANRALFAERLLDIGYQRDDGLYDGRVVSFGRWDAQPLSLNSSFVDGNSFDLGATEVDSDSHCRCYSTLEVGSLGTQLSTF